VLTAHKELQGLPFEALLSREGRFLVEDYDFSYVPSPDLLETRSPISPQASPLVLLPTSQVELPAAREEESFFRSLFPEARVARSLDAVQLRHTRWLHVAAHFRLDPRIWLASGFSEGTQERSILGVLGGTLDCSLMSLGVCDAGNGFSSRSPYWLGFAELFLARGVQALIVSRWRMDELSSRVYQDFYLACRQGVPMNEALAQARRNFLGRVLRRGAHRVNGRHPFFWAGIAYVGAPGRRLYEPAQTWLPFAAGLVLLAGCIGASVCLSRRASHRRV
jgi:CHAT domain-containing protein